MATLSHTSTGSPPQAGQESARRSPSILSVVAACLVAVCSRHLVYGETPEATADGLGAFAADFKPAEPFRLFADSEYPDIPRRKCMIMSRSRNCFVFQRTGTVEKKLRPTRNTKLVFYLAGLPAAEALSGGSTEFRFSLVRADGTEQRRHTRTWEASPDRARWERVAIELGDYADETVVARFSVLKRADDARPGVVCLVSDPFLSEPRVPVRPNVLVFSIETLRRDHMSLYGYERRTTPFLEELAREILVFDEGYSQSSWTRPSVASMLSGLYPSQHGARTVLNVLDDSLVLLPEVLRRHGYTTAAFVTNKAVSRPVFNYDQGYDLFVDEAYGLIDRIRNHVVEWLDSGINLPFFIFVHSYDPHAPYEAPGRFTDIYDEDYDGHLKDLPRLLDKTLKKMSDFSPRDVEYVKARYDAEIRYTDKVIEALVDDLKKRGLWDNTLLVITSDHGEEFYEHGSWGHGRDLYPEKLRVPFMVKRPAESLGGTRLAGVATGVDIMPTVLTAVGIEVPGNLPGVNLLATVEAARTPRTHHYAELPWVVASPGKLPLAGFSIIHDGFQYLVRNNLARPKVDPREQLFDLRQDRCANNNLALSRGKLRNTLATIVSQRYETGYTIALRGDAKRTSRFEGVIQSSAPIVAAKSLCTEKDDSFTLDAEKRTLRFVFTVREDDDILHFRTDPVNAAVSFAGKWAGDGRRPVQLYLGPEMLESPDNPVVIPAEASVVDCKFGDCPATGAKGPGAYIWRHRSMEAADEKEASPNRETLDSLKDLGYL